MNIYIPRCYLFWFGVVLVFTSAYWGGRVDTSILTFTFWGQLLLGALGITIIYFHKDYTDG